ncbi:sugar ABC transporter ATP-binding protein [Frankia sp. Cas3]|uniref:sugar ABC transporter ATP-binding protein n=1 Tax=Frankia sp. Cas3 TaxID=3073926 RepID=UPI002AD24BFD|nr:sugar ABC transporter ATP-binding protein [Frankia sp. Cas3]
MARGSLSPAPDEGGATAPRPVLRVRGLTKSFAGTVALSDFDLDIEPGEVHALVGENGSGKSTVIKILAGYHRPDPGGEVEIDGLPLPFGSAHAAHEMGARFVHQDLGLVLQLSVVDNLYLNSGFACRFGTIREADTRRRATALLRRVGVQVDPRTPVAALSLAQRTGVAVARALEGEDDHQVKLLVLDEPTATLPENEVHQLLDMVRRVAAHGVAVLYVSHRLDEIFQVADNVTVLRDGHLVTTVPVSSLDKRRLITLLVGDELGELPTPEPRGTDGVVPALSVRGLRGPGVRGVTFDARPGEIIGFAGITGSGRESLLGTVFGALPRLAGIVEASGRPLPPYDPRAAIAAGLAYLPPDRKVSGAMMDLSARENLSISDLRQFWRGLLLRRGEERAEARQWFERLSVRPAGATERPLANFSGGNQQKVLFAKWLRLHPKVFMLDEPTQGVDVGAKGELHRQLLAAAAGGSTILVSSSDLEELVALCHRVLVLRTGRVVAELHRSSVTTANISHACLGEQEVVSL